MRATSVMWAACMLLAAAPSYSSGEPAQSPGQPAQTSAPNLASYLPPRAQELNVSGEAIIRCTIADDGRYTDCSLKKEAPKNFGFGTSALHMAKLFQAPAGPDGKFVGVGQMIERRIDFKPSMTCVRTVNGSACSFGGSVHVFAPTPALPASSAP